MPVLHAHTHTTRMFLNKKETKGMWHTCNVTATAFFQRIKSHLQHISFESIGVFIVAINLYHCVALFCYYFVVEHYFYIDIYIFM